MISLRVLQISTLLALGLTGCGQATQSEETAAGPKEVEVVQVQTEVFVQKTELPGRIEPARVAEVRARVAGIVLKRSFEEGADVKAGDLLFQIDPAPFKAALSRAQGEQAKAQAALIQAQATVKRYEPLVKLEAVSQQDFDGATAALQSAQAMKRSAQADVETARLNLGYATVKSPITGRVGRALVTEGALVGQGEATMMARIQQLDPIYADFTQPVADALRMRADIAQNKTQGGADKALSLQVEGTDLESRGKLLFTDITVDRGTGQVSLRGLFPNPDGVLLPGMYVRVSIPQATDNSAIFVPQRAVQRGADGQAQVLVISKESKVEPRPVKTGAMSGSRWKITEGLSQGDNVIVGALNGLASGDDVIAKEPAPLKTTIQ
ncbi:MULTISPECIES: efflux RND transporter periplasmic adaptor subunit [unclassified Pseudomonas]|uniref:efflux RND transporter periplasmic adaptor subunit n=1 Tax=unclassified Pseudomonas TaxID=196821 RepID=UPI000C888DE4|nr:MULTISPECIES: efflux RND transporter periplasmic adaptor subunit [unclassified Pseudomonas]PMZ73245.1 efflux transporter periplasmic adaptor subunit [Pseudomonas sp. GW247-3R2A]PMY73375.1 efflux transporter periplasmic adaptor subunit [Pseudomonas sp. MPR-R3A]PMY98055.1 efflux transporter periplasmic adaptor subunit [Pseudomonas sp. FW305-124]PNA92643.1 efflux transporter periplasmic adaptor subunit [Pseudomonas sp. FW300-E2]PNB03195.1 efflux transporter periplasmic adaptor subunit [Pseudom